MDKKKTVGQIIQENNDKNIPLEDDVREYTKQIEKELLESLWSVIQQSLHTPLYSNRDFYIVLVKNVDKLLGQPKFQFYVRQSCPTPVYKQDVFKYHHISGALEFIWCIPSAQRYYDIIKNKAQYLANKETRGLAQFVLMMESGELLEFAKKENGELPDAVIRIHKTEH